MIASYTANQTGVYHYMTGSTHTNTQTNLDSYGRFNWVAVQNASGGYYGITTATMQMETSSMQPTGSPPVASPARVRVTPTPMTHWGVCQPLPMGMARGHLHLHGQGDQGHRREWSDPHHPGGRAGTNRICL